MPYKLILTASLASSMLLLGACSASKPDPATPAAPAAAPASAPAAKADKMPDPAPEEAEKVKTAVSAWVKARLDDKGHYAIPSKGDHKVSGTPADFHTVHQKDAQTYFVCMDFQDGDKMYDVDFFVNKSDLTLKDHYLHKINGKVITP